MGENCSSRMAGFPIPDTALILASLSTHCNEEQVMQLRSRYFCMISFKTGNKTPVGVSSLEMRSQREVMRDEDKVSCAGLATLTPWVLVIL